jgi:RNA-binding protein YlmH
MADKAKLTEEELKSIQAAVSNLNQAKTILGDVTNQAYKAQLQVNQMEEAMASAQKELEDTYGSITVDLSTGEYEEVVEEAEEVTE